MQSDQSQSTLTCAMIEAGYEAARELLAIELRPPHGPISPMALSSIVTAAYLAMVREGARMRTEKRTEPEQDMTCLEERIATLFDAIAHGSDEHRTWLKQAIEDHFAYRAVEPCHG